jgi:hypothetical protein
MSLDADAGPSLAAWRMFAVLSGDPFALLGADGRITWINPSFAQARRLDELLDMAQEFRRLGVWERVVRTGIGRWDRHVFPLLRARSASWNAGLSGRDLAHPS